MKHLFTGKIAERYLLSAIDKFWHHTCLKCTCCGATLADLGGSCFTKGNMILCKTDYSRYVPHTHPHACKIQFPIKTCSIHASPAEIKYIEIRCKRKLIFYKIEKHCSYTNEHGGKKLTI